MARRLTDLVGRAGALVAIGPSDDLWAVADPPSGDAEMPDVLWQTDLARLATQSRGGLDPSGENLTIYAGPGAEQAARRDAEGRLARAAGERTDAFFGGGTATG